MDDVASTASITAAITILALAGISFIGVTMESHSLTLDEACAFLNISRPTISASMRFFIA